VDSSALASYLDEIQSLNAQRSMQTEEHRKQFQDIRTLFKRLSGRDDRLLDDQIKRNEAAKARALRDSAQFAKGLVNEYSAQKFGELQGLGVGPGGAIGLQLGSKNAAALAASSSQADKDEGKSRLSEKVSGSWRKTKNRYARKKSIETEASNILLKASNRA
jgi:hypothetical protein